MSFPGNINSIIERVKSSDPQNSRAWFNQLKLADFEGGLLRIDCPDKSTAEFLEENCKGSFIRAAQTVTGRLVSVEFIINGVKEPAYTVASSTGTRGAANNRNDDIPYRLHPDLVFDNFVIGPCNRLAHASCVAVSASPGNTYNPLFLHGSVGLGKTHLLHAVCYDILKKNPDAVVRFLTCEEFVNRFIKAISENSLPEFQEKFRNVDVLIIDDVQFLRNREGSQEEFFHTFNALYDGRKQIILSADCSPEEIEALEERLVSRFKWGLVARIDSPAHETRVAIVRKKAALRGFDMADDIAEFIATKITTNIRELEGAITSVYAMAQATGEAPTLELAQNILGYVPQIKQDNIDISSVLDVIAKYYKVRIVDIKGKARHKSITLPRQMCMYLARKLTSLSLEEIGASIGRRDHTTVMHSIEKIEKLSAKDESINRQMEELEQLLGRP
ncbi:MAG: chromosomal replication initiator protein DnaA [Sedimentisphaeraceae bacterium JB056]